MRRHSWTTEPFKQLNQKSWPESFIRTISVPLWEVVHIFKHFIFIIIFFLALQFGNVLVFTSQGPCNKVLLLSADHCLVVKCGGTYKQQNISNSWTRKVDQKVLEEIFLLNLWTLCIHIIVFLKSWEQNLIISFIYFFFWYVFNVIILKF